MAISTAQYIDLLFKKLQGVAKTATATQKSASNESIASPALLRGDIVWTQADQIPGTAQVVANVTQGYLTTSRIECTADNTVPTIGGIYPTWLTNLQYWIPQEFGSTWPVKVYVDTAGAANPTVTGTQIFAPGIGGVGEFFFDTQAGVLNFIGETIPSTLTAGKSIFITGYRYVGLLGVTNLPSANIGNIQITGNTIATLNANGDLVFDTNGTGQVQIVSNANVTGNITLSGFVSATGNVSANYFLGNGSQLTGIITSVANINNGTSNVDIAAANANVTVSVDGTSNVVVFANTGAYVTGAVSASGNVTGGNVLTGGIVSATANIIGGNVLTVGLVSATGNGTFGNVSTAGSISANILSATGNITAAYFVGNGSALANVVADRGPDQNNWDTLTQMGVYTVNRVSWSGTQGTPLDSQIYNGLLEVKNSTNTAITQVFYPGTINVLESQIQWNRSNWSGSWSAWYYVVNNNNMVDAGTF
jgi:predicted ribosome-associated RNA-binding protein Tma20